MDYITYRSEYLVQHTNLQIDGGQAVYL